MATTVLLVAFLLSPYTVSYVGSDSMEPAIPSGSAYLLEPVDDVRRGEIVTFYAPAADRYVTHRVVGATANGYLTKGDANGYVDQRRGFEPVTRERIRGEVLTVGGEPLVLPFGRTVSEVIADHVEYLLFGLLSIAGLLRSGIVDRVLTVDQLIDRFVAVGTVIAASALLASGDRVLFVPNGEIRSPLVEFGLEDLPGVLYAFDAAGATVLQVNGGQYVLPEIALGSSGRVVLHYRMYLHTFPRDVLLRLHDFQPALAALVSVLPLSVVVWGLLRAFVGSKSPARVVALGDRLYPRRNPGGHDES